MWSVLAFAPVNVSVAIGTVKQMIQFMIQMIIQIIQLMIK